MLGISHLTDPEMSRRSPTESTNNLHTERVSLWRVPTFLKHDSAWGREDKAQFAPRVLVGVFCRFDVIPLNQYFVMEVRSIL